MWKDNQNIVGDFSVTRVWDTIRPKDAEVSWYSLVWHARCIPEHAFHLWLVMRKRLKTQDLLRPWDVWDQSSQFVCSLCELQQDSNDHLFFTCSFSSQVWLGICSLAGISVNVSDWDSIMAEVIPLSKRKNIESGVTRLVLAASAYFIWQERNRRLFSQQRRLSAQLIQEIVSVVRLKLLSFHYKINDRVEHMLGVWKMSVSLMSSKY
uniref:uncharacterized protein LOC122609062 n=1 Tax=Erigeron canadensis TaxID=72917 RepID=UPI001CB93732|nr:uncharacterized protein LOC122609062 [Erigeron canadensis]